MGIVPGASRASGGSCATMMVQSAGRASTPVSKLLWAVDHAVGAYMAARSAADRGASLLSVNT